jgi:hypothetical protein
MPVGRVEAQHDLKLPARGLGVSQVKITTDQPFPHIDDSKIEAEDLLARPRRGAPLADLKLR